MESQGIQLERKSGGTGTNLQPSKVKINISCLGTDTEFISDAKSFVGSPTQVHKMGLEYKQDCSNNSEVLEIDKHELEKEMYR